MAFAGGSLKTIADRAYNDALPMPMKEETKTTASEAYDDRKYANGAGAIEDFIVIEVDTKYIDVIFYFLYLLGYALCKSPVLS